MNHATMRNETDCVAANIERNAAASWGAEPEVDPLPEIMVLIDGAHIREFTGY